MPIGVRQPGLFAMVIFVAPYKGKQAATGCGGIWG